jgi:Tat protein secretion system quality control protein TatD with DNase activity
MCRQKKASFTASPVIAGKIAALKSMDPEKVEEVTSSTAEKVLNI